MDVVELTVVADRGYYSGEEIKGCEDNAIKTYLPKSQTSGTQAKGLYGKRDFIYKPENDEYVCPAGERAIYRFAREEKGKLIRRYSSSACTGCTIKSWMGSIHFQMRTMERVSVEMSLHVLAYNLKRAWESAH